MGEFGDKFRKAREKKELSLDDVSNVTKISSRMLRAIEEEHFDDLPGGVFNKGFIRAYAKHLGLDAEEAVTDYLASLRQAQIDAHEVWDPHTPTVTKSNHGSSRVPDTKKPSPKPAPRPVTPAEIEELPDLQLPRAEDVRPGKKEFLSSRSAGIPWRIVAAAALVIALGMALWVRHSKRTRAAAPTSLRIASAATQPAPAPQSTSPTSTPASTATTVAPVSVPKLSAAPPSIAASTPAAAQPPGESSSKAPSTPPSNPAAPGNSNEVTLKSSAKPVAKPSDKPASSLSLVIRATENSWVSVFSDGQLVTQETLIAPAHTSVRASREISVRVGNAAGVTFIWNGQEIPAQGAEAEVKNFVFDSSGMRASDAGPAIP